MKLRYNPQICIECNTCDCLMKCQYIHLDFEMAKEEKLKLIRGEDTLIIEKCVTCYSCEEYCPHNNHPFLLITERMEEKGLYPVPDPILKSQIKAFAPQGKLRAYPVKKPVINMCLFPNMVKTIKGELFRGASIILGSDIFCNLVYLHFGKPSITKERIKGTIDNIWKGFLQPSGVDEMVCYHDECYATYTHWAEAYGLDVPFKPIHLFEYLYEKLLELKNSIKPLGIKVAYQRPCSSRFHTVADEYVEKIFSIIGVERVRRKYDGENALCCGGVIEAHQKFDVMDEIQEENLRDMKMSGAQFVAFNCPFCHWTLSTMAAQRGLKPLMVYDLCRMAIGEL